MQKQHLPTKFHYCRKAGAITFSISYRQNCVVNSTNNWTLRNDINNFQRQKLSRRRLGRRKIPRFGRQEIVTLNTSSRRLWDKEKFAAKLTQMSLRRRHAIKSGAVKALWKRRITTVSCINSLNIVVKHRVKGRCVDVFLQFLSNRNDLLNRENCY